MSLPVVKLLTLSHPAASIRRERTGTVQIDGTQYLFSMKLTKYVKGTREETSDRYYSISLLGPSGDPIKSSSHPDWKYIRMSILEQSVESEMSRGVSSKYARIPSKIK